MQHFVAADTHIPERSFGLLPKAAVGARPEPDLLWQTDDERPGGPVVLTRPLLLFERPERVEAVAEVPDGPPIRFRWASGRSTASPARKGPNALPANGGATAAAA